MLYRKENINPTAKYSSWSNSIADRLITLQVDDLRINIEHLWSPDLY